MRAKTSLLPISMTIGGIILAALLIAPATRDIATLRATMILNWRLSYLLSLCCALGEAVWVSVILRREYRWADALLSASIGAVCLAVMLFLHPWTWAFETAAWRHRAFELKIHGVWGWAIAILLFDALSFAMHWLSHHSRVFWASHRLHHADPQYNLSTLLRPTPVVTQLYRFAFLFFILHFIGISPQDSAVLVTISEVFMILPHLYLRSGISWVDKIFVTYHQHRIHHARNDPYLNRNYGNILTVFDRVMGTYMDKIPGIEVDYGLVRQLKTKNPLRIIFGEYAGIAYDVYHATSWKERLFYIFAQPGWRPSED